MILVTGGAGFIGSALIAALNGRNIADILVVASGSPIEDLCARVEGSNLVLSWSPTGAVEYNVYSDSDAFGLFTNLEGTVSDTSFSLPTSSEKLFFIVKSSDGN